MKLKRYEEKPCLICNDFMGMGEHENGSYVEYSDIRWHDAENEKPDSSREVLCKVKTNDGYFFLVSGWDFEDEEWIINEDVLLDMIYYDYFMVRPTTSRITSYPDKLRKEKESGT